MPDRNGAAEGGQDNARPLLSPPGSEHSSPQPSLTSSAQHLPDFDASERPAGIRVAVGGEPAAAEAAAADARERTTSATPTHIIIGESDQPGSARVTARMSSGIHVDLHTRAKDGQGPVRRAAFRGHLVPADPEGAARRWQHQRTLLLLWFALSGVSVILCMWWLELGAVAGILGIIGASISVCNCPSDLNMAVSGTRIMSIVAMMMSILVALVCTYIVVMLPCTAPRFDQRTCDLFHVMLSFVAVWFAFMSALSGLIAYQTTQVKTLLDPKTQGVLTLH